MCYRSPDVQKGYGLGDIFRGVTKLFRTIGLTITQIINKPQFTNVIKAVGKETLNMSGEL